MRSMALTRKFCGLLVLLVAAPWVADAEVNGLAAKLASVKAQAMRMNADMGVRPTRTREDDQWEKVTGRTPASLKSSGSMAPHKGSGSTASQKGSGPAGQTHSCFDMNTRCSELVAKGHCTSTSNNAVEWMTHNCRRSCGICGTMTDAAPMPEKGAHRHVATNILYNR